MPPKIVSTGPQSSVSCISDSLSLDAPAVSQITKSKVLGTYCGGDAGPENTGVMCLEPPGWDGK